MGAAELSLRTHAASTNAPYDAIYDFAHERGTVVVGHVREYDVCPRRNTYAGNKHKHATNESDPPLNKTRDACVSTVFFTCVSNACTEFETHTVMYFKKCCPD